MALDGLLVLAREIVRRERRHFDVDVNAVEERAGDLRSIARDLIGRAATSIAEVAELTARQG